MSNWFDHLDWIKKRIIWSIGKFTPMIRIWFKKRKEMSVFFTWVLIPSHRAGSLELSTAAGAEQQKKGIEQIGAQCGFLFPIYIFFNKIYTLCYHRRGRRKKTRKLDRTTTCKKVSNIFFSSKESERQLKVLLNCHQSKAFPSSAIDIVILIVYSLTDGRGWSVFTFPFRQTRRWTFSST